MADMAFPAMSVVRGKDNITLNWVMIVRGGLIVPGGVLGFI